MDKLILSEGARKYGVNASDLELIGGFSNNVFECKSERETFILKFYLSSKYEKNTIELELDWILYLYKSGLSVASPLPSLNGNILEVVHLKNHEQCWIAAFEKAKGITLNRAAI